MPKIKSAPSGNAKQRSTAGSVPTTQHSGFSPVPVRITLSADSEKRSTKGKSSDIHYLWIREHKTRSEKAGESSGSISISHGGNGLVNPALVKPTLMGDAGEQTDMGLASGRTLFVANLAVDMDVEDIRTIFKEYGPVENISIKVSRVGKQGVEAWMDSDDEQDEDEDEDEGEEDEDQDAADGTDGLDGATTADVSAGAGRPARPVSNDASGKKRRRKNKNGPSAPTIVPLDSLLPRDQPFLLPSSSAYLTYLSPLSLQRALEHAPARPAITISHAPSTTGLAYYTQLHRSTRPDLSLIKAHADSALALYDHHVELQRRKTTQGAIVDEDGFTLVVRGGKFGRTAGKGSAGVGVASRRFVLDSKKAGGDVDAREGLDRGKKRKGGLELDGFYRFQRNERKRQGTSLCVRSRLHYMLATTDLELVMAFIHCFLVSCHLFSFGGPFRTTDLADLRKAFADDQAKVADLRAQKRFKPY